jgi:hypothetical protein
MEDVIVEMEETIANATKNITAVGIDIVNDITLELNYSLYNYFDDYNPPKYKGNISTLASLNAMNSQVFGYLCIIFVFASFKSLLFAPLLQTIKSSFDSFLLDVRASSTAVRYRSGSGNFTQISLVFQIKTSIVSFFNTTIAAKALKELSTFKLPSMHTYEPNVATQKILKTLLQIQTLLFLMDYMYRVVSSLRHLKAFFRSGVVQMPIIDLRTYSVVERLTSCANRLILLMELAPLVWIEALVIAVFVVVIAFVVKGA